MSLASCALIVYNVCDEESFKEAQIYIKSFSGAKKSIFALVGNQIDRHEERKIST
jgi:GTPase SAR1 family protein